MQTDNEGNIPMDLEAFKHVDGQGNCLKCGQYVESYLVRNFTNAPHDCSEEGEDWNPKPVDLAQCPKCGNFNTERVSIRRCFCNDCQGHYLAEEIQGR